MKKIVILGCENSHADCFLKFITEKEEFRDVEVIGVYSDDPEAAQKLKDKFNVPILKDYSDAAAEADGVIITARHGDNHYKYAIPYIEKGIPMFIDKPITVKEDEAIEFMKKLKSNSVRISGGSSLKQAEYVQEMKAKVETSGEKLLGGYVRAPYQAENEYGGFFFYAQHLVEMVCEVFGRFPLSVTAKQNGKQLHVLFHYRDFDCVGLFCDNNYLYYLSVMSEKFSEGSAIKTPTNIFYKEFKEFYDLLSGADQQISYEDFISPVFIMNAIYRSLENGNEEPVRKFEI